MGHPRDPRRSLTYDFRILEGQRNSAILRKKMTKKNGFKMKKKLSGFLGSPGSRTIFENPRDRDPEHLCENPRDRDFFSWDGKSRQTATSGLGGQFCGILVRSSSYRTIRKFGQTLPLVLVLIAGHQCTFNYICKISPSNRTILTYFWGPGQFYCQNCPPRRTMVYAI